MSYFIVCLGRSRSKKYQKRFSNRYKNDPYDSHGEDEGCPHCDKHGHGHSGGKHADCCPRYVDESQTIEGAGDDNENLDKAQNGAPPKQRKIQPLRLPGQEPLSDDDITIGDGDSQFSAEDDFHARMDHSYQHRPQSTASYIARTRAQSARGMELSTLYFFVEDHIGFFSFSLTI